MEMVKKYKRSDKVQLSKNFRLDEFKCKCGKCDPILVDDALVTWLQKIRDHFGKSVNVNSGYRCKAHNASPKVGGNPGSHHVKGMAADIRVEGITPEEVAKYAESIGIQRIGLYDTFVHIGSDTKKRFWLGHDGKEVETFGSKPKTVTLYLPVLKRGMKGDIVMSLQGLLNTKDGAGLNIDGSFGSDTKKALIEYQGKNNLEADGSCGKATWSKLLGV
jgi:hypothetical protein